MMTNGELERLGHYIMLEMVSSEAWMDAFARAFAKVTKGKETPKRFVSAKEAARILGISVWQLYRIKDDENGKPRFSYIKSGTEKSSTLKFNAATLVEEYERYISFKEVSDS
ncbi:MAG: hypothetical protein IKX61_00070 [Prevotella sp.]|nr:hypothetical protein [Prevotella sp.]